MSIILHITGQADWQAAVEVGEYRAASLVDEGFIHNSTAPQLLRVANKFYHSRNDLVILCIDEVRVAAEVKYEKPLNEAVDQFFPHIYGPLNVDAVVHVVTYPPDTDGGFTTIPADVLELTGGME